MKVLVVDDEPIIRDLAERILIRAGYEVELADSGQSGLQRFDQIGSEIGLVLLDLTLGDFPGDELLARLRDAAPGMPCIISSGQDLSHLHLPEKLKPNTHFLQKPYRANQLSDLVASILEI